MRTVLHLIESWGPGGAETVFLDVAEGVRRRGWQSLTAVPREGWVSRALAERGFDPIFTGGQGGWDVQHAADLVGLIGRHGVDLVQSHLFGSGLYGGVAAKIFGVPSVATLHGEWDLEGLRGYRRIKLPIFDRICDRKVFVSESLQKSYANRIGGGRSGSVVIPNGIDVSRFRPVPDDSFRRELGVAPEQFLVGTVGNVRPAKNHSLLLDVAKIITEATSDFHVALVGQAKGPLYRRLLRKRSELGLEEVVHFAGFREDVESVINSFDAYVLTSRSEGFSLTTVQAMATELPVVATRCGGPENLIDDGETGFLVDRGDARAMAEVLLRLRSARTVVAEVGAAARAEVRRSYSAERMVDRYERLYLDVLEASGRTVERQLA